MKREINMAFKLAIANVVKVPVKLTLNNGGKIAAFAFSVTADRLDQDQIKTSLGDGEALISEFLTEVVHDWHGQTLVIDENDKPADFGPEALEMMLSTAGVSMVIFNAYLKEVGAKAKN